MKYKPTFILFTLKVDPLTRLTSLWRKNKLHTTFLLTIPGARTEKHGVTLDAPHGHGLEVANHHNGRSANLILGHVLDQTRADCSRLGLSDIDGLNVKRVGIRVSLD